MAGIIKYRKKFSLKKKNNYRNDKILDSVERLY